VKKIVFILLCSLPLLAGNLTLKEGFVAAHTEMMMDSTIDPLNNNLTADIKMQGDDLLSLKGKLTVEMSLFVSDNSDRDKHMDEATQVDTYPLASYDITNVTKAEGANNYILEGTLDFHGTKNPLAFNAEIVQADETVTINATSMILVSEYGLEMPCMMFMCVRDQVDLFAKAVLSK
jgi:polyisoprenoid-binding protein YceI